MYKIWTNEEKELLKKVFPINHRNDLLKFFEGRSISSIDNKADELKLQKSDEIARQITDKKISIVSERNIKI
jgi:hypothetical protein